MPIDTYAYEEPCWSIRLERESEEDETEAQLVEEMLVAVEVLAAGWLEPLALHLSIGCYDTETFHAPNDCRPPRPQWFLRKETIPPGVEAKHIYVEPIVDTAPALTGDEIRTWAARALAQECPGAPRFIASWRELWWPAVRVKLPELSRTAGRDSLQVSCHAGTISVPLETDGDEVRVSGPLERYVIGPPVELTAYNEDGVTAIHLRVYWNLWSEDAAGREQVDAALRRVLALERGWERSAG